MKNWQIYSLLKKFLKGTTVHLRGRLDAGYVQKRRRQVDVQNYVVYSATSYRCFIVIQYCSNTPYPRASTELAKPPFGYPDISSFAIPYLSSFSFYRITDLWIFFFFNIQFQTRLWNEGNVQTAITSSSYLYNVYIYIFFFKFFFTESRYKIIY